MIKARGRSIVVLAAVLGWLPVVAAAAELSDHEKQLYAAAKQEGELTWYTGHYDQALATKIGNAFTKKYPGVQTNAIKATAQVTFQRLLQDIKAGQIQSDVFSSTDISHFVYLKQNGNLEKYVPDNEDKIVPALRKLDPDGFYTVTWAGLCAIAYNKDKVKAEAAPQSWPDLADPKWTGQVTVGSPNFSGSVGVWTVAMTTLYGWDYFTKLNQVKPLIGRSIDDAVTVLNAGERMVAMADPAAIGRSAAKGNPLGIIYPTDGTVAVIGPSALIKGSKSPNAGKLFLEFLLSPEAVTLIAENFEQSVRPDVPPPPGAKPLAELKLVRPSIEAITKELPGEKEKWKETFGQ
jgi:iron(III) transport system substrate-binding protein